MAGNPWTTKETATLQNMRNGGATWYEIAYILGRGESAVRSYWYYNFMESPKTRHQLRQEWIVNWLKKLRRDTRSTMPWFTKLYPTQRQQMAIVRRMARKHGINAKLRAETEGLMVYVW